MWYFSRRENFAPIPGQEYVLAAYKIDDSNFNVVKWTAVLSGAVTDLLGMKEKIQVGD